MPRTVQCLEIFWLLSKAFFQPANCRCATVSSGTLLLV